MDDALLAYLEAFMTEGRKSKIADVLSRRTYHFTVALEDVYQLHNTSAVMRSCEVFGIQQLHVVEQRFGKAIDREIAMGSQKWVDIKRHQSVSQCLGDLRSGGYRIVAAMPHREDCVLEDFDISMKSAIFFGSEKDGLSDEVIRSADAFVKIPMSGFTESLNISVSAAIILQSLTSRLRKSDIRWQLSPAQISEKKLDWARQSIKDIANIEKRFANPGGENGIEGR
jgi:tRNA (guanosine-2'-O-)-methyltransferase